MALFGGGKEKERQKMLEAKARDEALKVLRETIMKSELLKQILMSLYEAKDDPEYSWIALAEDYYDKDPREVVIEKDGDAVTIRRIRYFDEMVDYQTATADGNLYHKTVQEHHCEVKQYLSYGLTKSGFMPIDKLFTLDTPVVDGELSAIGTVPVGEVRSIFEDIVYEHLQKLFPDCTYRGRVTRYLGAEEKPGPQKLMYNDLTYDVPPREYIEWY